MSAQMRQTRMTEAEWIHLWTCVVGTAIVLAAVGSIVVVGWVLTR